METAGPWVLVAVGLFSILGGVMNWEWFMNHRKARFVVWVFGRTGARAFYVILGLGIAGFGVASLAGIVTMASR
jgi:hypothetical protein